MVPGNKEVKLLLKTGSTPNFGMLQLSNCSSINLVRLVLSNIGENREFLYSLVTLIWLMKPAVSFVQNLNLFMTEASVI